MRKNAAPTRCNACVPRIAPTPTPRAEIRALVSSLDEAMIGLASLASFAPGDCFLRFAWPHTHRITPRCIPALHGIGRCYSAGSSVQFSSSCEDACESFFSFHIFLLLGHQMFLRFFCVHIIQREKRERERDRVGLGQVKCIQTDWE